MRPLINKCIYPELQTSEVENMLYDGFVIHKENSIDGYTYTARLPFVRDGILLEGYMSSTNEQDIKSAIDELINSIERTPQEVKLDYAPLK